MTESDKLIHVYCPNIEAGTDAHLQIIKPGLLASDKCTIANTPADNGFILYDKLYNKWLETNEESVDVVLLTDSTPSDAVMGNVNQAAVSRYPTKPVIAVSYNDEPIDEFQPTFTTPHDNVVRFKRSMTVMKDHVPTGAAEYPFEVKHAAYCVRYDIHNKCEELSKSYENRSLDVCCFFQGKETSIADKRLKDWNNFMDRPPINFARGYAPQVVLSMSHLKSFVGFTTEDQIRPNALGRHGVGLDEEGSAQHNYVKTMCDSKIVVTACPCGYEGDYRLMEAMSSGALVLHNKMHYAPEGLVDGVHWIVYSSKRELAEKLCFYNQHQHLAREIAENGKDHVLKHHMPHHRIESWLRAVGSLK